ncbi:MAG: hypothetical protein AB7F66_01800 [Bacteriovoracia bacterium]
MKKVASLVAVLFGLALMPVVHADDHGAATGEEHAAEAAAGAADAAHAEAPKAEKAMKKGGKKAKKAKKAAASH